MTDYRQTKQITIGGFGRTSAVAIGGAAPVVIQTMWKDALGERDLAGERGKELLSRIENLAGLGCALLRFAVPDIESAVTLGKLAALTGMPLVADIHFDYRIALRILDFPIAKLRINPGNIGGEERVALVLKKALDKAVPVRVGVNAGSLPHDLREELRAGRMNQTEALLRAAGRELEIFDRHGFENALVSMKSSSAVVTAEAARLFARRFSVPLHIGVTEAGPLIAGIVRNTAALYGLLSDGIGDTLRVSLSDTMEREVIAAREILLAVNENRRAESGGRGCEGGVRIISCPRCGRCAFDTHAFTEKWLVRLYGLRKNITVAVMGCAVNGPEEARHADIGITGAGKFALIFKHGEVVRRIPAQDADTAFWEELESL